MVFTGVGCEELSDGDHFGGGSDSRVGSDDGSRDGGSGGVRSMTVNSKSCSSWVTIVIVDFLIKNKFIK